MEDFLRRGQSGQTNDLERAGTTKLSSLFVWCDGEHSRSFISVPVVSICQYRTGILVTNLLRLFATRLNIHEFSVRHGVDTFRVLQQTQGYQIVRMNNSQVIVRSCNLSSFSC